MRTIETGGITFIEPVPSGTAEWYCAVSREQGDLYEAEEIFLAGRPVCGNDLCLIRYPEGELFRPVRKEYGVYLDTPVFLDGRVFFLSVDFPQSLIRILCFDCESHETALTAELPLDTVRDCYNLQLHTSPLCLTRQGGADGLFEIVWPERSCFKMEPHESFFLRDGGRLFFSRWYEEGEGAGYRYWENTVIRDLSGAVLEILPGDVRIMPNGEMWHLK